MAVKLFKKFNNDYTTNGDILLKPLSGTLKMELNGLWSITLNHAFDKKGRWKEISGDDVLSIPMPSGKQGLFRINDIDKDTFDCVVVTAKPLFYDLTKSILEDVRPTNKTVKGALDDILTGTKFTGHSDITDLNTAYYVLKSKASAIMGDDENSILNRWGKGEVYFDNYDIYVNNRIGGDYGVKCIVGKNATVLKENINYDDIITRAYVKMYDGLMLPEKYIDSPNINIYEEIKAGVIEFNDIKVKKDVNDEEGFNTEEEAFEEARKRVKSLYEKEYIDLTKVSYSADMITINNTFKNINRNGYIVDLGDTVTVKSDKLGVDIPTRAIAIEWDFVNKKYINVDFSNEKVVANNSFYDRQNRIDSIFSEDNPSNVKGEVINGFIQGSKAKIVASKDIAEKQHTRVIEFVDEDENSPTYGSTMVGTQGMAVSNQKTLDGKDWDYTTAVNGNGIFANILYGKIFAGANGYIDLENCDFRLGGDKADDIMTMTNKFLEFKNIDGSLIRMDYEDGICNIDGETKRPYFFRKDSGEVELVSSGGENGTVDIQLPDWYKGRNFKFDCNISAITSNQMPSVRMDEEIKVDNIDYENAIVTVKALARLFKTRLVAVGTEKFWAIDTTVSSSGGSGSSGGTTSGDWENGILSAKGFRFIKGYEAFAPYKYQDSSGYWTIAYGVTAHGEADIYNQLVSESPLTEEKAAKVSYELKNDRYGKNIIQACKDLGVTQQYEFDALLSLAYNCGYGVVTGDNSLTRAIKAGEESTIRSTWEKFYITSDGVELEGLKLRRKAEASIFLDNNYEMRDIPTLDSSGSINGTVSGDGWLPEETVVKTKGEMIVDSCRKLIGLPYVYGGLYPPLGNSAGVDCSGLCMWGANDSGLLNEIGLSGRWTTYSMINHGISVTESELQVGDFVLPHSEHVFVYSGEKDGQHMCVEAPRTGLNIRERAFTWDSGTVARRFVYTGNTTSTATTKTGASFFCDCNIKITWSVIC